MRHALLALTISLVAAVAVYPALLSVLVRMGVGQRMQAYGPTSHSVKAGTPTMGGLVFCAVVVATWLVVDRSRAGFLVVFALMAGAGVGVLDDLANMRGAGALGLPARQKLIAQALIGTLLGAGLHASGFTRQLVPFMGVHDFGWWIVPLAAFAVVAASNAVNLTDGVDGLAATCAAIAVAALAVISVSLNEVPTGTAVLAGAALGGLIGFLFYNWFPARVFMGDTGSLALGCALVALSCELRMLWLLPLLGIVFVVEALSVIVNVTAVVRFKRRLLRASPLHHHFEALGLREERLVFCFGLVGLGAALLTVLWATHAGGGV